MVYLGYLIHFLHANILKYCPNRKFSTIEEHDNALIKAWNLKINPNDTVFHLGDVAFSKIEYCYPILNALNGRIVLITGNHDIRHIKDKTFCSKFAAIKYGYHELEVKFKGYTTLIVLSHYPFQSWNKIRYGSFHFHGHCHNNPIPLKIKNMSDIGVDTKEDHTPWEKNEILEYLSNEKN